MSNDVRPAHRKTDNDSKILHSHNYVRMYAHTYVCMYVSTYVCIHVRTTYTSVWAHVHVQQMYLLCAFLSINNVDEGSEDLLVELLFSKDDYVHIHLLLL